MSNSKLERYIVYAKLTVWGESPEDALDYAYTAVDNSDLLTQDGIVGIELIDDTDSIELVEEEETGYGEDEDSEDY
jgi:hypothetical protein